MNKKFIALSMVVAIGGFTLQSCNNAEQKATEETTTEETATPEEKEIGADISGDVTPSMFGEEIEVEGVTAPEDLMAQLQKEDTLRDIVIAGKIESVCKKKGCWMNVQLTENEKVFVKFKDYGFFVPLDSDGSNAVMQGNAYKETISVEELQHYAEDDGKSEEEIAAITEPETRYLFMASGVILTDYVRSSNEPVETPKEETQEPMEESTEE